MKKTIAIKILLCSAGHALGAESTYVVRDGDMISSVIKKHVENYYHRSLAVYSQEYNAAMAEFITLNPHIKNLDAIFPGQEIRLPQIGNSSPSGVHSYKIKRKDNLWNLSREFYPALTNPLIGIAQIKMLNPQIKGDMIYPDKFLTLPKISAETFTKTLRTPAQFLSNVALDDEIYHLSRSEAQSYIELFRKITQAQDRAELKEICKMTISIAQIHRHFYLEEAFIELTSMLITSTKEDHDISAIQELLMKWKRLRKQKHLLESG